jgi:carbamoyl-phosphate synthase large subunit
MARPLAVALVCIFVGNLIRITASVAVGYVSGEVALVLFHDWVGSVIGYMYVLVGFMIFLRFLLPEAASSVVKRRVSVEAPGDY